MFAPGKLKILQPLKWWGNIDDFLAFATESGYEAASWNGTVFVLEKKADERRWIQTVFESKDFDVNFDDVEVVHHKSEEG